MGGETFNEPSSANSLRISRETPRRCFLLNHRPEKLLQEIFAKVCVQPSIDLGLVSETVSISGDGCSPSDYGRVVYTKTEWDLRLFTKIPRGSLRFKEKMKERTAAERVNNRILHHYGLENSKTGGKKKISFLATIAGFNIHLDAQLAALKARGLFDFVSVFGLSTAA